MPALMDDMDVLDQLRYVALLLFPVVAFYCLWSAWAPRRKHGIKEAPEPPGALPLLGHLRLLRGRKPLAETLGDIADKCGPVFALRLGMQRTLVVCDWKAAKECFSTNDRAFAARPRNAAGRHLGFNYAMVGLAPYGAYWRALRKITSLELLSNARIQMLGHVRAAEVGSCVRGLFAEWIGNGRKPVRAEMKQRLGALAHNIVVRVVAGKSYYGSDGGSDGGSDEGLRFQRTISDYFKMLGAFVASDMFPFLKGWVDWGGREEAMKRVAQDADLVMTGLLEEHRRRQLRGGAGEGSHHDFMDVMLTTMEDAEFSELDKDTVIKTTSLALILGGTDTTSVSLVSTLAAMVNHRDALAKVQSELDAHVGRHRWVDESDVKNLPYFQAVVKETFRLFPAARVLVPHEAISDCQVGGFHVPAGTQLLVNAWKIQRDPAVWPDPDEFKPERFLAPAGHAADVDVRGQHFELIPFGSGRRACPGISFSLQVMHLALARLIQGFDLWSSDGQPVVIGKLGDRSTPLELMLAPRLPHELYESA